MRKIILREPDTIRTKRARRWLGWLSLCTFLLFGQMSFAQVNGYSFTQTAGVYQSVVSDGVLVAGSEATTAITNDTSGWSVSLPFTFTFNAVDYTSIYVNSNGGATFGATTSNGSSLISSSTGYSGAISVMDRDLWGVFITSGVTASGSNVITNVGSFRGIAIGKDLASGTGIPAGTTITAFDEGASTITMSKNATSSSSSAVVRYGTGKVFTKVEGASPNRVFTIQWEGYNDYITTASNSNYLSFQLKLTESSNTVKIVYGDHYNLSTTARTSQLGLRGATNADYNNRTASVTTPWNSTTSGISNSATVSRNNVNFPASGLTFTWTPPSCFAPTTLSATNITQNSADLTWAGSGSNFDIEWGTEGFPKSTGTTVSGVSPYSLEGLSANTSYSYYVRQNCGGGDYSAWLGPYSFTTIQDPATSPYMDDFSTNQFSFVNGTQANKWAYGSATGNPANAIYISNDGGVTNAYTTGSASVVQAYRDIAVPSGATVAELGFDWKGMGESSYDYLRVWLVPTSFMPTAGTQIPTGAGRVQLGTYYNQQATWQTYFNAALDVSSFAGQTMRLVFEWKNDSSGGVQAPIAIDNVLFEIPSCPAPAVLAASNITTNSAELSWTSVGSIFDVEWGVQGFVQGNGTTISGVSNPYILNGLEANTLYSFYVRRDCTGESSNWSGPYNFKTLCGPQATVFENFDTYTTGSIVPDCWVRLAPATSVGSQSISSTSPASGTRNIYQYAGTTSNAVIVVLPEFSNINAGTHWLRFKARVSTATGTLMVGYVTDVSDYSSFTVIENLSITNTTYATDSEYTVAVPASVPANARLAIKNTNDAKSYYWDDVYWEVAPSCLPVTGLTSTEFTTSTASISWTAGDSETSWNVSWGASGYTPEDSNEINNISVSSTSYQITSLAADTAYDVYVRANCGVGDESTWVGPLAIFTGHCQPTTTNNSGHIASFTADGGAAQSISNLNTGSGLTGTGYSNFSAQAVEVAAGGEINYVVTIESEETAGLKIWVDWDNNMMFDQPSEVVYTSAGYSESYTGSFTIPANASGTYRMRIGSSYTPNSGPANACTHSGQGEYEDYTISIVSACSAEWTGFVNADWNTAGNWCDNTVPTAGSNVVIDSANPAVINTDVSIASITLGAAANVTVNGSLNVGDISVAAGGSLVVANDANLFQSETAVNSGNITVKRNAVIKHLDYTIWSSPVMGQGLQAFSPNTLASRIYDYNTTTDTWQITTGNFIAGKGVMFRAPNLFDDGYYPNAYTYQGTFTGTPHNGDITVNFTATDGTYQGVGNPYPSNMDVEEFWMNNAGTGTLYFWTNTNAWDNAANDYLANNWATYSLAGGVPAAGSTKLPESVVSVGQGFVVQATGLTSVSFNNDMRTAQNSVFFRAAASDKHRLWLNLADASNEVNNLLIGYMDGATQGEDLRIDSKMFNYEGSALYSLIDGSQSAYIIQGRSLPFDDFDVVPLGFRAMTSGSFTVSLTDFDGVFAQGQDIFLKDNLTQTQHNLKDGDYTFVSNQGEFTTRFEVVYRASMDVTTPELDTTWVVYAKDKTFFIETQGFDMKEVVVYDMLGRVIYQSQVEGNSHAIAQTGANQVLIIKVISTNNEVLTKKVNN